MFQRFGGRNTPLDTPSQYCYRRKISVIAGNYISLHKCWIGIGKLAPRSPPNVPNPPQVPFTHFLLLKCDCIAHNVCIVMRYGLIMAQLAGKLTVVAAFCIVAPTFVLHSALGCEPFCHPIAGTPVLLLFCLSCIHEMPSRYAFPTLLPRYAPLTRQFSTCQALVNHLTSLHSHLVLTFSHSFGIGIGIETGIVNDCPDQVLPRIG